eukprot:72475-Hanusia_phi.AAC.2
MLGVPGRAEKGVGGGVEMCDLDIKVLAASNASTVDFFFPGRELSSGGVFRGLLRQSASV